MLLQQAVIHPHHDPKGCSGNSSVQTVDGLFYNIEMRDGE